MSRTALTVVAIALGLILAFLMFFSQPSHEHDLSGNIPCLPAEPTPPVLTGAPLREALQSDGTTQPGPASAAPDALPARALRGIVIDAERGQPIGDARVALGMEEDGVASGGERVTRTDPNGAFLMDRSSVDGRSGSAVIVVVHPGYRPWRSALSSLASADTEVVVELERGASLSGVVSDDLGMPVEGARVTAQQLGAGLTWPRAPEIIPLDGLPNGGETRSNALGEFVLFGLDASGDYEVQATKTGFAPSDVTLASVGGAHPQAQLTLTALATIHVQIRDAHDNSPLEAAVLFARPGKGLRPFGRRPLMDRLEHLAGDRPLASFQLQFRRGTPPPDVATVRVAVSAPGFQVVQATAECDWGEIVTEVVTVQRQVGAEPQQVAFRAAYEGGRPFAGSLLIQFRREEDGSKTQLPMPSGLTVTFDEQGHASSSHMLMTGTYTGDISGVDNPGIWWRPAGPSLRFSVDGASGQVAIPVEVRGSRVQIEAVSDRGSLLRGYGLEVRYPIEDGGHRGGVLVPEWDVPPTLTDGVAMPTARSWVHVSPGEVELEVRTSEGAVGVARLVAGSTGDLVEVKIPVK